MPDRSAPGNARRPRVWCPGPWPADGGVVLTDDIHHHLVRVLRMRPGEVIELFDGEGQRASARLEMGDALGSLARIEGARIRQPAARLPIRLAQALPQGDKMDWVIEKAVELGVSKIQPLQALRSVVRLDARKMQQRSAHWNRVAVAAATQCGQDRLPTLHAIRPAADWLAEPDPASVRLILDPRGVSGLEALVQGTIPQRVDVAIGPESGWDPRELEAAARGGWIGVRLGPRILRTETAGLAVLAALQDRWGDWSNQEPTDSTPPPQATAWD